MNKNGLILLAVGGLVFWYVKTKGVLGLAKQAAVGDSEFPWPTFGAGGGTENSKAVPVGSAAGGQKDIQFISPSDFEEIDRNGWFGTDKYDMTFELVNGTAQTWKGVLVVQTVEDSGDLPVITDNNYGTLEIPANTKVRKTVTVPFHGYYVNLGSTQVQATIKLASVAETVTFNVD